MFNEFNAKGVRNLIWVWTSECNDSDWYPGDNYVDIIGCDDYSTGDQLHGSRLSSFNKLKTIVNGNKIITMSECGGIPNPTTTFSDGATWSWFMPWYGDYTESSSYNGASYWKTAMSSSNVITRSDLPSFKQIDNEENNICESKHQQTLEECLRLKQKAAEQPPINLSNPNTINRLGIIIFGCLMIGIIVIDRPFLSQSKAPRLPSKAIRNHFGADERMLTTIH